jgi:hypothetical protein
MLRGVYDMRMYKLKEIKDKVYAVFIMVIIFWMFVLYAVFQSEVP